MEQPPTRRLDSWLRQTPSDTSLGTTPSVVNPKTINLIADKEQFLDKTLILSLSEFHHSLSMLDSVHIMLISLLFSFIPSYSLAFSILGLVNTQTGNNVCLNNVNQETLTVTCQALSQVPKSPLDFKDWLAYISGIYYDYSGFFWTFKKTIGQNNSS